MWGNWNPRRWSYFLLFQLGQGGELEVGLVCHVREVFEGKKIEVEIGIIFPRVWCQRVRVELDDLLKQKLTI